MPVTTFVAPVAPGKTEAWKRAVAEIKGARKAEYEQSRRRMGITREVVSLQSLPHGDVVVVFLEGTDPANVVAKYLASDAPFDKWFAQTFLREVHGLNAAPPPTGLFLDWKA